MKYGIRRSFDAAGDKTSSSHLDTSFNHMSNAPTVGQSADIRTVMDTKEGEDFEERSIPALQLKWRLPASLQAKELHSIASPDQIRGTAEAGVSGPSQQLPYLDTIQRAFGSHDLSGVKAHVGGEAAEASDAIGATAYSIGEHVAFKDNPDLPTVAHEVTHVVQQREDRVHTLSVGMLPIVADPVLERD